MTDTGAMACRPIGHAIRPVLARPWNAVLSTRAVDAQRDGFDLALQDEAGG